MIFKYSAIGDNTPENREHLEELGYKDELQLKHRTPNILITSDALTQYAQFYTGSVERVKEAYPDLIDCTGNPALFQAVTAMRDDSDYKQWFFYGNTFFLCELNDIKDYRRCKSIRKATLAELQVHFK